MDELVATGRPSRMSFWLLKRQGASEAYFMSLSLERATKGPLQRAAEELTKARTHPWDFWFSLEDEVVLQTGSCHIPIERYKLLEKISTGCFVTFVAMCNERNFCANVVLPINHRLAKGCGWAFIPTQETLKMCRAKCPCSSRSRQLTYHPIKAHVEARAIA